MICGVEGVVVKLEEQAVSLKTAGGVSYRIFCGINTVAELATKVGRVVSLRVEMQMREDSVKLYGFSTPEERRAFRLLIKVPGISGHLALAVLSTFPAEQLGVYLAEERSDFLTRVPGIGAKLAKRVTAELSAAAKQGKFGLGIAAERAAADDAHKDALSALVRLGYGPGEVSQALNRAKGESAEELIADTLKELAGGYK